MHFLKISQKNPGFDSADLLTKLDQGEFDRAFPNKVSLASGAEVNLSPPPPPPPEKYSTFDAGRFCRYEWAYPVQNSLYFNANVSVVL
jgi:hypothetical protein